jgi:hypothetical protein
MFTSVSPPEPGESGGLIFFAPSPPREAVPVSDSPLEAARGNVGRSTRYNAVMGRTVCFVFLWLSLSLGALAESSLYHWDPSRTRGVIVGVLSWQDPAIGTFSSLERKDRELHQTLLARGVPPENLTLLLDQQATQAAILEALHQQMAATGEGETFLFYYAGHGVLSQRGGVRFLPYDGSGRRGLEASELTRLMGDGLSRAERVLLFADCCYSGALGEVARRLESQGVPAAALTSATAELPSTSNWTFTQTLLDCLQGQNSADRDGDLQVTLGETARELTDAMRFYELQQSGVTAGDWLENLVIADTPQGTDSSPQLEPPYSLYDYVLLSDQGRRGMGRLVGRLEDNFVVAMQAYNQRVLVEVPPAHMSPLPAPPARLAGQSPPEQLASLDGKYSSLLRTIEVEPDYLEFGELHDYGFHPACGYRGYEDLPEGYWVYLYPHWYIWGEQAESGAASGQSAYPGTVRTTRS